MSEQKQTETRPARERILNGVTRRLKREPVMMGDVQVYAWGLSQSQRSAVEAGNLDDKGNVDPERLQDYRARVLIAGTRDGMEDNAPFTFLPGDEMHLRDVPAAEVEPVFEAILRLSGMTKEAREEVRKNSEKGASGGSSTGSPSATGTPAATPSKKT